MTPLKNVGQYAVTRRRSYGSVDRYLSWIGLSLLSSVAYENSSSRKKSNPSFYENRHSRSYLFNGDVLSRRFDE